MLQKNYKGTQNPFQIEPYKITLPPPFSHLLKGKKNLEGIKFVVLEWFVETCYYSWVWISIIKIIFPWGPRPGVKPHRIGCKMTKFLSVSWSKNFVWPVVNFKIQNLYNLALKSGGGQVLQLYWQPKILIQKGLWSCYVNFLITRMGFWIFLIILSTWYTYLHIVTQTGHTELENNYFWKVFLLQLEAKVKIRVFVGKCPRCSSIKSTKKKKKTATHQWKC